MSDLSIHSHLYKNITPFNCHDFILVKQFHVLVDPKEPKEKLSF